MNWQIAIGIFFFIGGLGNIFKDFGAFVFGSTVGLCLLYYGLRKKGLIKSNNPNRSITRTLTVEDIHAVGVSYYEDNIRKLAYNNPDWNLSAAKIVSEGKAGKRIFRYNYVNRPVKLQFEPENPHDKHAIAILIAGELVGYVSKDENVHVKDILQNHEVKSISGFIGGGEYKVVSENKGIMKSENGFSVNVRIKYI